MGDKGERTMWKATIRYMAYHVIYTDRIHANLLCRMRFMAIKALADSQYLPAHYDWCPICKYRCLQRAGVYDRACRGWEALGVRIPKEKECNK